MQAGRFGGMSATMSETGQRETDGAEITAWPTVLEETFAATADGWTYAATGSAPPARYDAPGLVMTLPGGVTSVAAYWYTARQFGDAAISVTLTLMAGDAPAQSYCGVSFRARSDQDNYRFFIDGEGFYRLTRRVANVSTALIDWTASPAIKAGAGARNRIQIVAEGERITVTANGVKLASITDGSFTKGHIALQAQGGSGECESATVFRFQDFEIAAPT